MKQDFQAGTHFLDMVQENPSALRFWNQCGPIQRRAIDRQLDRLDTPEQLRGFVDHLPSAAL